MNKRSVLLILLVLLLMFAALVGLPMMAGSIAREEMRGPVIETCTPMPVYEMDAEGNYMGSAEAGDRLFFAVRQGFTTPLQLAYKSMKTITGKIATMEAAREE